MSMCKHQTKRMRDHRISREERSPEGDKFALHTLNLRAALVVVVRELLICIGTCLKDE